MNRWTREELVGADLVWLLTITIAGREVRWSSRPVATVDADGRTRPFDGGLEGVDVAREIQGPGAEPALPTASLDLLLPGDLDLPTLIEQGHDLAGCPGELALWAVGTPHEDRRIYLVGIVQEPEYGDADEPVSLTLSAIPWESSSLYPPVEASITLDTWPEARDEDIGASYPVPVGRPGAGDAGGDATRGSIAYPVEFSTSLGILYCDKLLLAYGRVTATAAKLIYTDTGGYATITITHEADGLGQLVAVADISSASNAIRTASSYYVAWDSATGGGIQGLRDGTMDGAGDILAWAMRTAGYPVQQGAFDALSGALNVFRLGLSIEQPVDLYEWAVEHVLPLLPAELIHTGTGAAPVVWHYGATEADALEHLDADDGGNVVRAGRVTYSSTADICNDVRVRWGYDTGEDDYTRLTATTLTPTSGDGDDILHPVCRPSQQRYGVRTTEIESQAIYSRATAGQVIGWLLDVYGYPWRSVTYEGGQELGHLDAGDPVTITDSALAWSRRPAMVRAVRWTSEATVSLDLILLRLPARDLAPGP